MPLLIVLTGTLVTFLDFFVVNVALPSIAGDLHAAPASVSLVVAGYGLTFAAGMITGGRLGDLYGRRRMFLVGLALFTLTSLACGLAPGMNVLVAARVLQGAAGALLTPQVLAIIGTAYEGARRERAFAAYGLAMGIAGVLGQLLGGALIHADIAELGWRAIFLINVPIGLVVAPLARRHLPESYGARTRLDGLGVLALTAALAALVLPLVEGREHGWPAWTWASLALAPVLLAVFIEQQRRRNARGGVPLVDLALFSDRRFSVACVVALTFAMVPSSFFFVLALYLQDGRGYGALFSGIVFVAVGVGYFLAMLVAGPLAARLGRQVLAAGAATAAAGCVDLVASAHAVSSLSLVPGLGLLGLGIGAVLVPVSSMALGGVDPQHAGAASGVLSSAQQVGGAVGVALIGTVFFDSASVAHAFAISLWVIAGLAAATAFAAQFLSPSDAHSRPSAVRGSPDQNCHDATARPPTTVSPTHTPITSSGVSDQAGQRC